MEGLRQLKKKNSDKKVGNISYINDWINDYKLHNYVYLGKSFWF